MLKRACRWLCLTGIILGGCDGGPSANELQARAGMEFGTAENPIGSQSNLRKVERLLDKGADVNGVDGSGWTALHRAADGGHIKMVKLLISRGASLSAKTPIGETPLNMAARNGHDEVVRELLANGADINARNGAGMTPYQQAVAGGHSGTAQALLSFGATANDQVVLPCRVHRGDALIRAASGRESRDR